MKSPVTSNALKFAFRSRAMIAIAIVAISLSSFALAGAQASGLGIVESVTQIFGWQPKINSTQELVGATEKNDAEILQNTLTAAKTADNTDGSCGADCSLSETNETTLSSNNALASPSDTTQNITQSGNYRITVRGADGARVSSANGGSGATVAATFALQAGDVLTLVPGIAGENNTYYGGGGGSAVILTRNGTKTLLIVAGAGGGGGDNGENRAGGGGISAQGTAGGGGGGFNADGANGVSRTTGGKAGTLSGGGAGGGGFDGTYGNGGYGFGGGGGGNGAGGGGGGGYGGGNSVFESSVGGTSYVDASGTNISRTDGTAGGSGGQNGSISITQELPNLSINDVSMNEGNSGTTSFTFTVSLSAPAGAGGVTFDIATANNTAAAPGDYTANSLTGQTIPAGSSTYSFTVLVNGDATLEANETFFVNVTNVTGANVTDGQGLGTITNDEAANPSAVLLMSVNSTSSNVPGINENFSYDLQPSNNGNAPLNNFVIIDTLPNQFQAASVTTGSYSNLAEFAAGEGVRVSYEKNTAPGVFTLWGSSPNVATNTTLTAPPPGLGAGEYITRIRWEYGQAAPGMTPTNRPRVSGKIINPSNAGNTVNNGDSIQNCASLSAVYTAGPTNVNRNACRTFAVGTASQTLVVDNTSDDETLANCTNAANDCSLRGAISAAFAGDTVSFSTLFDSAQTINLNGQLLISKNLTINGKGANLLTVRQTAAGSRVFEIRDVTTASLSGMTITGGNIGFANGAGIFARSHLINKI